MRGLLYRDEVYQVVGAAFEVYNELGNGFLEPVYQEALEIELRRRAIPFESQVRLEIQYKGRKLEKEYIADLIVFDKIIIELKAIQTIGNNEKAQLIDYLKARGYKLGLIINFGAPDKLQWERIVYEKRQSNRE